MLSDSASPRSQLGHHRPSRNSRSVSEHQDLRSHLIEPELGRGRDGYRLWRSPGRHEWRVDDNRALDPHLGLERREAAGFDSWDYDITAIEGTP